MYAPLKRQMFLDGDDRRTDTQTTPVHPSHSEMDPTQEKQFKAELLECEPLLRSFAQNLSRNRDLAEDLTQDTLLKAWRARSRYTPGSNLKAWLHTIMRNLFYSYKRRSWREMPWDAASAARLPDGRSGQTSVVELRDTLRAFQCIPSDQREALALIAAGGFSYSEAAEICHCKVGTLKSRVARARQSLISLLDGKKALPAASSLLPDSIDEIAAELAILAFGTNKAGLRANP
jgi:RNA polymerase sigma-70 factor (ECF subfamily)